MPECTFCKIVAGGIPAKVVYRDDDVIAVEDINPQAPTHLLVMPVEHFDTLSDLVGDERADRLVRRLFEAASQLGQQHDRGGYRLVVNTGHEGGQTVGHLHIHVLGGRAMTWPPG
ncbi:MAG TPA: histidine triad nucleotide-binding protein [Candidatus Cybelea sp.]|nr:histidine triad nucleotide-binding protein [Candidatus Cybelea sp.]